MPPNHSMQADAGVPPAPLMLAVGRLNHNVVDSRLPTDDGYVDDGKEIVYDPTARPTHIRDAGRF